MTREIKFRAWGNDGIVYPTHQLTSGDILNRFSIIMQFTGLKDKNGVEVYEGDICRIIYSDWPSNTDPNMSLDDYLISISHVGYIEYHDTCYYIMLKDRYDDYNSSFINPGKHGFIEIIGNIHDNPELL